MNSEPERPSFTAGKSSTRSSSPRFIGASECEESGQLGSSGGLSSPGNPPKSSSRRPASSPSWPRFERVMGNYSAIEKLMLLTCISVLVSNLAIIILGITLIVLILR